MLQLAMLAAIATTAAADVQPFQFRVRGTTPSLHLHLPVAMGERRPPFEPGVFGWGFPSVKSLEHVAHSADGVWSNWTAVSAADLAAVAAVDARTKNLPHLIMALVGTWSAPSPTPPPFSLARVDVELAPMPVALVAVPPVVAVLLSATLGFRVGRAGTCTATLGLLLDKAPLQGRLSAQTFGQFNNHTYWHTFPNPLVHRLTHYSAI